MVCVQHLGLLSWPSACFSRDDLKDAGGYSDIQIARFQNYVQMAYHWELDAKSPMLSFFDIIEREMWKISDEFVRQLSCFA